MSQLDYDLDEYLSSEEKTSSCCECGAPISDEKLFCSEECYKANNY